VEQFENYKKKTSRKYKEMARRIYDTYILNDSYLEINLDDRVKRDIADQMNADNGEICPSIFADAQTSAYIMLESSFIRFLHTQYLRHQQNIVIMHSQDHGPLGDSLAEMNIKHYDLTKAIVNGFIRDLFDVDYFDPWSSSSSVSSSSSLSSTKPTHSPSKKLTKRRLSQKRRKSERRIST